MGHKQRYFEGWYFKHRTGEHVFAAIPGMSIGANGKASAFIQTISNEGAQFHTFPISDYFAQRDPLLVRVGGNRFSRDGVLLDVPGLRAEFTYGPPTPLQGGDIMGPFARVPFMECYHGIDSLLHRVDGFVEQRGARLGFDGGSGYIERDWGRSFPNWWVWLECHDFPAQPGDSIMMAVAEIPFLGMRFTGILCVCRLGGRQIRIATYHGARLFSQRMEQGRYRAEIRQGHYALAVDVRHGAGGELRAPCLGAMNRAIIEYPCCDAQVSLRSGEHTLMDARGGCCGFECVR